MDSWGVALEGKVKIKSGALQPLPGQLPPETGEAKAVASAT
jgi:hypothetical protein